MNRRWRGVASVDWGIAVLPAVPHTTPESPNSEPLHPKPDRGTLLIRKRPPPYDPSTTLHPNLQTLNPPSLLYCRLLFRPGVKRLRSLKCHNLYSPDSSRNLYVNSCGDTSVDWGIAALPAVPNPTPESLQGYLLLCRKVFFDHHIRPVVRRTTIPNDYGSNNRGRGDVGNLHARTLERKKTPTSL